MKDLTKGSVGGHILQLSLFIAMSTTFQTLYFLADLYFVGKLGKEAIAGVALGGNLMMLVLALTQSLGVGATALIAQAMGRQDRPRAERLFNQALVLSNLVGLTFGLAVFALRARLLPMAGRRCRRPPPSASSTWTGSCPRSSSSSRSSAWARPCAASGDIKVPDRSSRS